MASFPSTAGDFGSYSASSASGSMVVPKPANTANGDVLFCACYLQVATTFTPPAGWTLIYKAVAASTRGLSLFYHKVTNAGSEPANYSFSFTGNARGLAFIFRGVDIGSSVVDGAPTSDVFGGGLTLVDPAVTAVATNAMLIAVNFTNSSTTIFPAPSCPGFTKLIDNNVTAAPSTSTVSVLYKQLTAAGSTGNQTITFDQSAASSGGFLVSLANALAPVQTPLQKWAANTPAYCAHRDGFYATYGEFTVAGFAACAGWNRNVAWNIDVFKTSDGEWVASHDQTTGRVLSGTSLDIPSSTWASISGKTTLVGGYPVARLDDIVASAPAGTIFFVDNKQNSNQSAFFTKLSALGLTPANTVVKNFAGSNANNTAARAAGYQVWMYFFDADVGTSMGNLIAPDWVGFDLNGTQANWNTIIASGRSSFAHILGSLADKTTADTKASTAGGSNFGYMVSNVAAVVPKVAPPVPPVGSSATDLKYNWMKAHAPSPKITDTMNDLEYAYLGSLGFTGTLNDRRLQKWPTGEFAFMKAAVGTQGVNQTLDDLRMIYYAGP